MIPDICLSSTFFRTLELGKSTSTQPLKGGELSDRSDRTEKNPMIQWMVWMVSGFGGWGFGGLGGFGGFGGLFGRCFFLFHMSRHVSFCFPFCALKVTRSGNGGKRIAPSHSNATWHHSIRMHLLRKKNEPSPKCEASS